jgi:hypothetical protein
LDEELGVGKAHAIADGGTEHLRVLAAGKFQRHEGLLRERRDFQWLSTNQAGFKPAESV